MKAKPAVSNIICFEHRQAAFFKALQLPLGFGAKAFRWRTGDNRPFPFWAGCQGMPTVTCNASSISILPATGDKRAGSAGAHQFGQVPLYYNTLSTVLNESRRLYAVWFQSLGLIKLQCSTESTAFSFHSQGWQNFDAQQESDSFSINTFKCI